MERTYLAAQKPEWNYVGVDNDPPAGCKILVLTHGGTTVVGDSNTQQMLAWSELMGRDKVKELVLNLLPNSSVPARRWYVDISKQKLKLHGWDRMEADLRADIAGASKVRTALETVKIPASWKQDLANVREGK